MDTNKKKVKSHATSERDGDKTYQLIERNDKEAISDTDVVEHWEARAERPGLQTVMSTRYTVEENEEALVF